MNNLKIAEELIKIAKELTSSFIDENRIRNILNENINQNELKYLFQEYSDEISKYLQDRMRQGKDKAVVVSLKKWLKDNHHEDWINGKKFEAISKYNEQKIKESHLQMKNLNEDACVISFKNLLKDLIKDNK